MENKFLFPFGEPLKKVEQIDRSSKEVFVLGVYASAVHAKWINKSGKTEIRALAVASEPEIFWTGDNALEIINKIKIPSEMGKLIDPGGIYNGPSGRALDKFFLNPLNLSRKDTWLCDIIPYSRMNKNQQKAIDNRFAKLAQIYQIPEASIPPFRKEELNSLKRRNEILNELEASSAHTIVLLGDEPVRHFLSHYTYEKYKRLSDFGDTSENYGQAIKLEINSKEYNVIPLCHPRQAGRLGRSSHKWNELHSKWMQNKAGNLANELFSG